MAALEQGSVSLRDGHGLQVFEQRLTEQRHDILAGKLAVAQLSFRRYPGFDVGKPHLQIGGERGPGRHDIGAGAHLVDQTRALDLSLAFSLGFQTMPFALSLSCSRIADIEDRIPIALTALAYMALHKTFPLRCGCRPLPRQAVPGDRVYR